MTIFRNIKLITSKTIWTRPTHIKFPNVWGEFDGKKEIDGKLPHFWIQDVEKSQVDVIINLVVNHFYREEPYAQYTKIYKNPKYLSKVATTYKDILDNHVSIVCMTSGRNGEPTIAGFNCMEIMSQTELKETMGTRERLEGLLQYLLGGVTPYAYFGVEEYLRERGLYILPEYRRQGICTNMLTTWSELCSTMKVHRGLGIFTSSYSQSIAKSIGFREICTVDYEDLRKVDISYAPLGIEKHKCIQINGVFV